LNGTMCNIIVNYFWNWSKIYLFTTAAKIQLGAKLLNISDR